MKNIPLFTTIYHFVDKLYHLLTLNHLSEPVSQEKLLLKKTGILSKNIHQISDNHLAHNRKKIYVKTDDKKEAWEKSKKFRKL